MIFFNIDDTIVNTTQAGTIAAGSMYGNMPELGNLYKEDEFPEIWNASVQKFKEMYASGSIELNEMGVALVREVFQRDMDVEEAEKIYSSYIGLCEENWKLFPDVITVLEKFKDVPKGIITNGDPLVQKKKLTKTGVDSYFEHVIVSGEAGFRKPDAGIFLHACKAAGRDPFGCYHVGSTVDVDAAAAKKAGLLGIWLNRNMVEGKKEKVAEIITLLDFNYIEF